MTSKTYIIADTHFEHTNIIKYQHRPFINVRHMNETIFNNWNSIITCNDIVYFLGDLCIKHPRYWLNNLNGEKILIRGNHDRLLKNAHKYKIINYNDENILLIHSPEYIDFTWNGWIIHGHHHNNEPETYPFINNKRKTINVSVEMINYKPIELSKLLNMRVL
jgi:calcineurin-like phosphoesterase family protein